MTIAMAACLVAVGCSPPPADDGVPAGIVWRSDSMVAVLAGCPEAGSDSACVRVAHRWVVPVDRLGRAATDSLMAVTMSMRVHNDLPEPASSVDSMVAGLFESFRSVRRDFPDMPAGWFDELDISIGCDSGRWFAIRADRFWFSGGAHPNTVRRYVAIDRGTGATIPWRTDVDTLAVMPLAERAFRDKRDIGDSLSLNSAGWFFADDEFSLPAEGMRCGDQLTLYWNPYEVGPYSMGPTEVTITLPAGQER